MLFLLFAAAVSARVMDSLVAVPKGWELARPAASNDQLDLRVALQQPRASVLEQVVMEISTPGHSNYGMHMSREELRRYTAPDPSSTSAVLVWLREYHIESSVDNDWISFTTTAATAGQLLNTTFAWYQFDGRGDPKLRTLAYSVPDSIAAHIDLIQPTTRFGQLGAQKSTIFDMHRTEDSQQDDAVATKSASTAATNQTTAACSSNVDPNCLKKLYNINYTASAGPENTVAFCSYLEQYARYADLDLFEDKYVPAAKGQNFSVELVNGGLNNQTARSDSGEANLDLQYILGISHPIPIIEYSTAGRGPLIPTRDQPFLPGSNEPYLEWLLYMLSLPDASLPQTISTSYGEEEQSIPLEYALKTCNLFMQLGARGVSIIFSSGDSGPGNGCQSNVNNQTIFEPTFPAGCPWVTSVGATIGTNPERAVSFSSGGFSNYFPRPSYQAEAVPAFLTSIGATYSTLYNSSGRGIPDLSAQGSGFKVFDKGVENLLSGTSASAPVVAGIVALLNAARRTIGQPPLGFLNPWLYNVTKEAWNDVTTGYGIGCYGVAGMKPARWNATGGWDPVTGLGTPRFDVLLREGAPGVPNM